MKVQKQLSCVLIGDGTLPLRCGEIVLAKGHSIAAIVSGDADIRRWAMEMGIDCLEAKADLVADLSRYSFDYLFSIVNAHILSDAVLRTARKMAINYHDAPLPRYAGTHATSWAIINGEKTHGATWHQIASQVDAGDILRQSIIEISENDTAFTLNTKCYEAAVDSFSELVDDLAGGSPQLHAQDLAKRTFFPRYKGPANAGVISWTSTAAEISQLVRALDFGPHPNPLGSPKLLVGDSFLIVKGLEVLELASQNPPGTINEIGEGFVQVSTADKEVVLWTIFRLDGRQLAISELVQEFNLERGCKLATLDPTAAAQLESICSVASRNEKLWLEKLSAVEPAIIPFPAVTSAANATEPSTAGVRITSSVLQALTERKSCESLTAAFAVLLWRLSGIDAFDIAYNDSLLQAKTANFRGLFDEELPLRVEIGPRQSIDDILTSVKTSMERLREIGAFPLDLIARYPKASGLRIGLPVAVEITDQHRFSKLLEGTDLKLVIPKTGSECRWIYDRNRVSDESVAILVHHFETLLESLAVDPSGEISHARLLTDEDLEKQLVEWNNRRAEFPKDRCIHHLFEEQVKRTPGETALVFGEHQLTYDELNRRANRLAHYLRKNGVGPESLVGVCIERSVEMVVAVIAILKAGGAYVPLDPKYPRARIQLMLEDSNAPYLVTMEPTISDLDSHGAHITCLDRDRADITRESEQDPEPGAKAANLAYVIYTSGSTGKPKGVAIEHRSTVAFLYWALSVFTPEQLKGVLASTSVCFDLSIFEMFAPLSCGGTVILVQNILYLSETPAAEKITLVNTVPSAISELIKVDGLPTSVKTVNLAGEFLKPALVKQIYALGTVEKVFDLYGPTEDTTYSTFTPRDFDAPTIGHPISNTQAYILDKHLQPLPVGIPGELYLGGDGLARGYLNRPDLTSERFVANPFTEDLSARIYKTGDLVRYRQDGEIEYLGRIDNQVKIRGFRIELGEIESTLLSNPAVRETVVVAHDDQTSGKQLAAYFVTQPGYEIKGNELRDFLKKKLPDHMVPSAFVELEQLPLTPNGKVDRKALTEAGTSPADTDRTLVHHRDPLEEQLVSIWELILNVTPIGINEDFFELGGNSLHAVRMFAQIEKVFNKNIPLATLFQAGTIEQLAEIVRQDGWEAPESSIVPIQPNGAKPIFFCVHAKGGNVLFYRDLAKHLGDNQPFYGIQARRLGGRQVGHSDMREMAEFYIKEMQTLQPEGPYFLGGSSFGGLAAFEMAQQLRAAGNEVALLALLDTGTPTYPEMLPDTTVLRRKLYTLIRRVQLHRDNLMAIGPLGRFNYAWVRIKKVRLKYRRKVRDTYKRAIRKVYQQFKGRGAIPKSYIQLEDHIWRAGQNYKPKSYDGKVTLFRATLQPLGIRPDPTLGWANFVEDRLEIHDVPGHHGSIVIEPYVQVLAEKLAGCIENAQNTERQFAADPSPSIRTTGVRAILDSAQIRFPLPKP
ncbi:MAG: amino acid adenylation domain-containing protein [Pyrinomonadaceae bacterium]